MNYEPRSLWDLSAPVKPRWINPENPTGQPASGGSTLFGRKGAPCRGAIGPGETWVLGEADGPGVIRRIWITESSRSPLTLRGLVLRIYWDGQNTPAVEAPLGDFFGSPLGRTTKYFTAWFENPEGRNFNSLLPMPFKRSFKMTVTNESPVNVAMFWFQIDHTVGDELGDRPGYLHARFFRENPTVVRRDFTILPRVSGAGRYLGCNIGLRLNTQDYGKSWWGEGEVKIYLDGDDAIGRPTLCGTGAEDYVASAWGLGEHVGPWTGCTINDSKTGEVAMYRYHGPDPIFFEREVRVTLQAIGGAGRDVLLALVRQRREQGLPPIVRCGDGSEIFTEEMLHERSAPFHLFERHDDVCATALWYLDRPEAALGPIEPYEKRVAGLTNESGPTARADV